MSQSTAGTLDITFKAGEALTAKQYHFVKLNGTGGIIPCSKPNFVSDLSVGILQNHPADGKAARVRLLGTSKLVMGTDCAEMALLISDANGHGEEASVDQDKVGAIALEASGGADEIIEVLIAKMHIITPL